MRNRRMTREDAEQLAEHFRSGKSREEVRAIYGMSKDGFRPFLYLARRWLGDLPGSGARAQRTSDPKADADRVYAEVASGERCPRCHLLLPCNPFGEECAEAIRHQARLRRGGMTAQALGFLAEIK